MRVKQPIKKLFAALVVAAAVVIGTQLGGSVAAGAGGQPAASVTANGGNPNAQPPILPRAPSSELAAMRQAEAQEAADELASDPPPTAHYSGAEMNAYANGGK
jgi:hypothetical protein